MNEPSDPQFPMAGAADSPKPATSVIGLNALPVVAPTAIQSAESGATC